jgi:hypothetical protein
MRGGKKKKKKKKKEYFTHVIYHLDISSSFESHPCCQKLLDFSSSARAQ